MLTTLQSVEFKDWLADMIVARGKTKKDLEQAIGTQTAYRTVNEWLNGKSKPRTFNSKAAIAKSLGIPVADVDRAIEESEKGADDAEQVSTDELTPVETAALRHLLAHLTAGDIRRLKSLSEALDRVAEEERNDDD